MMKMTESGRKCPRCGVEVPGDAPRGLCPRCVMVGATSGAKAGGAPVEAGEMPAVARVQEVFPQLEILEAVGRGGMGFVYKARQPNLDRVVALKLLPERFAQDPEFAERFNREGRFLARLNHPNIVSVHDFGRTGDFYFLTMEYVDGVNLRQAMQAGRFSPAEALAIVPQICAALQYAHGQGVLHRDIKPENILLDGKGGVKIADFGIAKMIGEERASITLTQAGATLGTPQYMAPEQLERPNDVDHRADIYSLGVVFYELLTGELPLGRFDPPSASTPVGTRVDQVVMRTLEKDRGKRHQSAGELKTEIENVAASPGQGVMGAAVGAGVGAVPPAAGIGAATQVLAPARISRQAVIAAGMVVLALVLTLGPLLLAVAFGDGFGWRAILFLGFPGVMIGLVGTILGWVAWARIRASKGRLTGKPMAIFASFYMPVLAVLGVVLVTTTVGLSRTTTRTSEPSQGFSKGPAGVTVGYEPVGGTIRVPKGLVATLEIVRGDQDPKVSIPDFVGYVLAPTANGGLANFRLEPDAGTSGRWAMQMVSEDGAMAHVGFADLGPLTLASTPPMSLTVDVTEGMDQEILLTRPEAPGGTRRMALNVRVRGYRRTDPQPLDHTTVGAGSLPPAALSEGGK
jgi:predicted Ser/Thr protein kinase